LPFDADLAAKQPYGPPEAGYDQLHTKLHALTDKLTAAATEEEIPVLDFQRLFIDEDEKVTTHYFLEDGVHPNREGHRRMAEAAAIKLKKWFFL
jgi:lysophospholipase L1-like esterase